jgi:folate-dependent phosphoribosylglycinamide formyltransferase PurN
MTNKKICVFAYNFNHFKTQNGIINMILSGFKPDLVILQDWKKLNIRKSNIRIAPRDLYLIDPRVILDKFNINYIITDHNSQESIQQINKLNCDLGVILGSRILSHEVIQCFNMGILNLHPGILPENRGLDTIQWAVVKNIKQGVTSHIISKEIDKGFLVLSEEIKIYDDDTLVDMHIRILNLEQKMMIESLNLLLHENFKPHIELGSGCYHSTLDSCYEDSFYDIFEQYKKTNSSL